MHAPPIPLRDPYVGDGPDGARRSSQIDLEQADLASPSHGRDDLLLSATRWTMQAEYLEALEATGRLIRHCQCEHHSHAGDRTRPHPDATHPYLGTPASNYRAPHYGAVCQPCFTQHLHIQLPLLKDTQG